MGDISKNPERIKRNAARKLMWVKRVMQKVIILVERLIGR